MKEVTKDKYFLLEDLLYTDVNKLDKEKMKELLEDFYKRIREKM